MLYICNRLTVILFILFDIFNTLAFFAYPVIAMAAENFPRFVTPYKYAQLCGVSESAIYGRIKRGALEVVEEKSLDGTVKTFVDTEKFPPGRLINYPIEYSRNKGKS